MTQANKISVENYEAVEYRGIVVSTAVLKHFAVDAEKGTFFKFLSREPDSVITIQAITVECLQDLVDLAKQACQAATDSKYGIISTALIREIEINGKSIIQKAEQFIGEK